MRHAIRLGYDYNINVKDILKKEYPIKIYKYIKNVLINNKINIIFIIIIFLFIINIDKYNEYIYI